jgi:hypothetical protein
MFNDLKNLNYESDSLPANQRYKMIEFWKVTNAFGLVYHYLEKLSIQSISKNGIPGLLQSHVLETLHLSDLN